MNIWIDDKVATHEFWHHKNLQVESEKAVPAIFPGFDWTYGRLTLFDPPTEM